MFWNQGTLCHNVIDGNSLTLVHYRLSSLSRINVSSESHVIFKKVPVSSVKEKKCLKTASSIKQVIGQLRTQGDQMFAIKDSLIRSTGPVSD